MHLCYIDESGTSAIPGSTSHFVLAGLSMPDRLWKSHHDQVEGIKRRYDLQFNEVHVAWLLRPYREQQAVPDFAFMSWMKRRSEVLSARTQEVLRLQRDGPGQQKQVQKNYKATESYIHLTLDERRQLVQDLAGCVSGWGEARLFAECIDKAHFQRVQNQKTVDEQAFEQIVSRFEQFLKNGSGDYGLLVHDANSTVEKKHTERMKNYLQEGTLWTGVEHIIETPMFVDRQLTGMVQMADVCSYALRRYVENGETELFDLVFQRAHRIQQTAVGVRHYTEPGCQCRICSAHRPWPSPAGLSGTRSVD